MSDSTIYLITGSNRGIGFDLVKAFSVDSNNIVIAGVRDPASATALQELSKTAKAKIHIAKIDSADEEGNRAAAKEIEQTFRRIDVLWANAGVSDAAPALTQRIAEFERNFKVNALGPVVLFQSFYDLLSKSTKPEKKFIVTSTALGSQAMAGAGPFAAYGMSKAAVNHFGLKVHKEHGEKDKLVVVLVHPGLVATDMTAGLSLKAGDEIDFDGVKVPVITPEHSAESMKKLVTEATYETHGGKFLAYDGSSLPW